MVVAVGVSYISADDDGYNGKTVGTVITFLCREGKFDFLFVAFFLFPPLFFLAALSLLFSWLFFFASVAVR